MQRGGEQSQLRIGGVAGDDDEHAPEETDEVRWFTHAEAGELRLAEDTAEVVRLGFEKTRGSA